MADSRAHSAGGSAGGGNLGFITKRRHGVPAVSATESPDQRRELYGSGIQVFSMTFLKIWSCPGIGTSIPLYRTVVHVQNGARRQLRAPGESFALGA